MQLALRRSFGYAFAPPLNRGIQGLGDCGDGSNPAYDLVCGDSVTPVESPVGTILTQPVDTVPSPISTTLSPTLCPDGSLPFSDGSCTETSAPANSAGAIAAAAQVAQALSRALAPTVGAGGAVACPAGYTYGAAGQSVQLSPGVATVGAGKCLPVTGAATTGQLISGISNTTLGIAAVVLFAVLAMGGKRR